MMALAGNLQTVEAENQKLKAEVHKLCEENAWLCDELENTKKKLQACEQKVAQFEENQKHLEFMNAVKKYDNETGSKEIVFKKKPDSEEPLNLGFPKDDDDSAHHEALSITPSTQMSASTSAGYEILDIELYTVRSSVIQNTVGEEEMEKNSGLDHPDVATKHNTLALVYRDQKKCKEAANLLNDDLAIREKTLGENHFAVKRLKYPMVVRRDLACLDEGKDLNDTVIEFYLKWIINEKLNEEMQEKTHLCSTYFSTKLMKDIETKGDSWRDLVKWLKKDDLFAKDFIIIPMNIQYSHWFLVTICYLSKLPSVEVSFTDGNDIEAQKEQQKSDSQKCERPAICFFDSSSSSTMLTEEKLVIAKKLRNFLKLLWLCLKGVYKTETRKWKQIEFFNVICPQQQNAHDCGIYLLQFAESFFENPITEFKQPLSVMHWFNENDIANKRKQVKSIIEQNMGKRKRM